MAGLAAWADALLKPFTQAGYVHAEPSILQPAEPFLDLSGEGHPQEPVPDHRHWWRGTLPAPDLTIPVARDYLASNRAGQPAGFSYLGPVVSLSQRPRQ